MRIPLRRVLAAAFVFGWACSGTENSTSEAIPGPPERTMASDRPAPTVGDGEQPIQRPAIPVAQSFEGLCRSLAFAPVTVPPILDPASRRELIRYLAENDPVQREVEGDTDEVKVWVCVDDAGRVQNTEIAASSGSEEVDALAEEALTYLTFTPAEFEGQRVPTWISLPVFLRPG